MNITNYTRVVFYGCSFTTGAELSDYKMFPELSFDQVEQMKLKMGYDFYLQQEINLETLNNLDNEQSWSRWFADEIGLPWLNRAKRGSSMGEIVFTIEQDLINNIITEQDLVVVGIPTPTRLFLIDEHGYSKTAFFHNFENDFGMKLLKFLGSDDYLNYHWTKELNYLDMLSTKLQGRLFQQFVWATPTESMGFNRSNMHDNIKNRFLNVANLKSLIDPNYSMTTIDAWINSLALKHPVLEIHQKFGRHVADKFKLKLNTLSS
jgi:hypothetical protein